MRLTAPLVGLVATKSATGPTFAVICCVVGALVPAALLTVRLTVKVFAVLNVWLGF